MDPYLEDPAVWEEFHHVFITECMYHVGDRLPPHYVAKIVERTQSISVADQAAKEYIPDIAVARRRGATPVEFAPSPADGGGTAVAVRTATIPAVESTEVREGYIEIRRLPAHDLVTCIEVLSPWHKFGEGVGIYREKRRTLVSRGINVVELDLLLRGTRTELAEPIPVGDYYAFVFQSDRRPDVDVYAWRVRDPFPELPVPLRTPERAIRVDLAAVFNNAYDRSHYDRKLRYADKPPHGLSAGDAAWVDDLLKSAARR